MALCCCGKDIENALIDKQAAELMNLGEAGLSRCPPPRLRAQEEAVPVTINVYSLVEKNTTLAKIGLGVFHTGVVVYGIEWSYGEVLDNPEVSGLFCVHPGQAAGSLYKTIRVGHTTRSPAQVDTLLHRLENEWRSVDYHILHHNCNHFAQALCNLLSTIEKLEIPRWCNRIARAGDRIVPRRLATKIHRMCDEEPPKARKPASKSNINEMPVSVIPRGWYLHPSVAQPPRYRHERSDDESQTSENATTGLETITSGLRTRYSTVHSSYVNDTSPAPGFTAEEMANMEVLRVANLPALAHLNGNITTKAAASDAESRNASGGMREDSSVFPGMAAVCAPTPVYDDEEIEEEDDYAHRSRTGRNGGSGHHRLHHQHNPTQTHDSATSIRAMSAKLSTEGHHGNTFSHPPLCTVEKDDAGVLLPLSSIEFQPPAEMSGESLSLTKAKHDKVILRMRSKTRKSRTKEDMATATSGPPMGAGYERQASGDAFSGSYDDSLVDFSSDSRSAGAASAEPQTPSRTQVPELRMDREFASVQGQQKQRNQVWEMSAAAAKRGFPTPPTGTVTTSARSAAASGLSAPLPSGPAALNTTALSEDDDEPVKDSLPMLPIAETWEEENGVDGAGCSNIVNEVFTDGGHKGSLDVTPERAVYAHVVTAAPSPETKAEGTEDPCHRSCSLTTGRLEMEPKNNADDNIVGSENGHDRGEDDELSEHDDIRGHVAATVLPPIKDTVPHLPRSTDKDDGKREANGFSEERRAAASDATLFAAAASTVIANEPASYTLPTASLPEAPPTRKSPRGSTPKVLVLPMPSPPTAPLSRFQRPMSPGGNGSRGESSRRSPRTQSPSPRSVSLPSLLDVVLAVGGASVHSRRTSSPTEGIMKLHQQKVLRSTPGSVNEDSAGLRLPALPPPPSAQLAVAPRTPTDLDTMESLHIQGKAEEQALTIVDSGLEAVTMDDVRPSTTIVVEDASFITEAGGMVPLSGLPQPRRIVLPAGLHRDPTLEHLEPPSSDALGYVESASVPPHEAAAAVVRQSSSSAEQHDTDTSPVANAFP